MKYDHLTFFIADLDDIPEVLRSGNTLEFIFSTVKYAVIGVLPEIYDEYIKDYVFHKAITRDLAIKGKHWWGDIRVEKSAYDTVDGITVKKKVQVSEETISYVVELMKTIAKMIVEYEMSQTSYSVVVDQVEKVISSNPSYNRELLQKIEECATIRELNIIYEDYLGCEMPSHQANELGLYDEERKRIFEEYKVKPSFL